MRKTVGVVLAFMVLNAWMQFGLRAKPGLEVQPETGRKPFLTRIAAAEQRVLMTMYRLTDREVVQELCRARARGLFVMVILHSDSENQAAFDELRRAGAWVTWGNPEYGQTHQKSVILDREAWILTHNLSRTSFEENRGFALRVTDIKAVAEIEEVLLADWERKPAKTSHPALLWAPGNARSDTLKLLGRAKKSLELYCEHMSDPEIERALLGAAARGVTVRLLMSGDADDRNEPARRRLREGGVQVRTLTKPFVHAKVTLVDGKLGSLGSLNYSPGSLDRNRELAALVSEKSTVGTLRKTFERDWATAGG